jgi:hypothetical protein
MPILSRMTAFAQSHQQLTKFAALTLAIGAGLAIIVGGALAAAGINASIALAGAAFATWHTQIDRAFNAVMTALEHFGDAMYLAGAHLMSELARGIGSAVMAPVTAIENVTRRLRGFLPFSPAHEGPLADLHRTQIVQTIAASIKPAPMLDAMRRVALAAAIAIPIATSMPVVPALAAIAPMLATAPAQAATLAVPRLNTPVAAANLVGPGATARPQVVIQNVSVSLSPQITIAGNAAGMDDRELAQRMTEALRTHLPQLSKELLDNIERELSRRARSDY